MSLSVSLAMQEDLVRHLAGSIDVFNYEWNQGITSETRVVECKAVLKQTRTSLLSQKADLRLS
jgi:hypothetical protein